MSYIWDKDEFILGTPNEFYPFLYSEKINRRHFLFSLFTEKIFYRKLALVFPGKKYERTWWECLENGNFDWLVGIFRKYPGLTFFGVSKKIELKFIFFFKWDIYRKFTVFIELHKIHKKDTFFKINCTRYLLIYIPKDPIFTLWY